MEALNIRHAETESGLDRLFVKKWRGLSVEYSRVKLPADYSFSFNSDSNYLAHHDLVLVDGEMDVTGEPTVPAGDLRDKMTYVPSGYSITGWCKPVARRNSFTAVYFAPHLLEEEFEKELRRYEQFPLIYFKNENLNITMRKLSQYLGRDGPIPSEIYAETLGLAAALEVSMLSTGEAVTAGKSGQLSRQQARRVNDYIELNFRQDIALDELAAAVGLTRFHFSRAFKATFGESPYRYITLRRAEEAKRLLATTDMKVDAIAKAIGYGSSTVFARSFFQATGFTPNEFRRRS